MRVLIADDDQVTLQMLSAGLHAAGIGVITAMDAMQAVMLAMKEPPDVVLLDIHMPGGTGLMVLKRLKASIKTARVPVIAMTSTADDETRAQTTTLGAVECLEKPLQIPFLVEKLKTLVA